MECWQSAQPLQAPTHQAVGAALLLAELLPGQVGLRVWLAEQQE